MMNTQALCLFLLSISHTSSAFTGWPRVGGNYPSHGHISFIRRRSKQVNHPSWSTTTNSISISSSDYYFNARARRIFDHSLTTKQSTNLKAITPHFEEVCETTGITLTRFMHEVERCNPELQELAQLFSGIQIASKAIHNLVKRSQLPGTCVLGLEGAVNVQGEDQKVRMNERTFVLSCVSICTFTNSLFILMHSFVHSFIIYIYNILHGCRNWTSLQMIF